MENFVTISKDTARNLRRLKDTDKRITIAIRKAFHKIGLDLKQTGAKALLFRPKSGRSYKVDIGGVIYKHTASAPGESPAELTGALRKTLDYKVSGAREMRWQAGGGIVDYAADLEFGIDKLAAKSYGIAPRPYMERAIKENRRNIGNNFSREIKMSLRRR